MRENRRLYSPKVAGLFDGGRPVLHRLANRLGLSTGCLLTGFTVHVLLVALPP